MSTTISVTAEHIEAGIPETGRSCPVALAVREAFPRAGVHVHTNGIALREDGDRRFVDLPDEACAFIAAFDQANPVEPFTFTVDYEGTEVA